MASFPDTPVSLLVRLASNRTGIRDEAGWTRLFELYAPAIRAFAEERGSEDESEDVVQEIFMRLVEVLRDGRNTLAVTLLRAVGEIGDWGVFPTPLGQKKGTWTLEYAMIPYATDSRAEAYREGYGARLSPATLAKLRLAPDTAPIDGGIILRCGPVEANCSLSMLMAANRRETEARVSRILFGDAN